VAYGISETAAERSVSNQEYCQSGQKCVEGFCRKSYAQISRELWGTE